MKRECERTGKPFEYAFLLDALSDEQDQGITIDTARCFFKSATRDYIIIDAPGHIEFLKNMISGAARAEAAVLVIDAKEGVRENSRRHGYILSMLGIRQVVVCVNKMDLVGYKQDHFNAIEKEYRAFLEGIGAASPRQFVPVAAVAGVNLAEPRQGDRLVQGADAAGGAGQPAQGAAHGPTSRCACRCRRSTSSPSTATTAASSPGGSRPGRWRSATRWCSRRRTRSRPSRASRAFNAAPRTSIEAGWSTGFTLTEEIYVTRGEVMSHVDKPPLVSTTPADEPDLAGQEADRHRARLQAEARHRRGAGAAGQDQQGHRRQREVDSPLEKDNVGRHDVADVVLELKQPVAFDLTADCEATGRFVIVDEYDVAGGGIITAAVKPTSCATCAPRRSCATSTGSRAA